MNIEGSHEDNMLEICIQSIGRPMSRKKFELLSTGLNYQGRSLDPVYISHVPSTNKAMKPQWKITKDLVEDGRCVGTCGPYGYDETLEPQMTAHWRCFDDDGELYYEGIATPSCDFHPLDDFCQPNAGCTEIHYLENGEWNLL